MNRKTKLTPYHQKKIRQLHHQEKITVTDLSQHFHGQQIHDLRHVMTGLVTIICADAQHK